MRATVELIFRLTASSVFAALALGGCGGGEPQLTKAQFIRQADAVCKRAAAEQAELASPHKGEVVSGNLEAVTAVFVPPMEKELHRLRELGPPEGDEGEVRTILKQVQSGIKDAKYDYLDLFVKETDPFAKANAQARRYGLHACAESSHAVIRPQG